MVEFGLGIYGVDPAATYYFSQNGRQPDARAKRSSSPRSCLRPRCSTSAPMADCRLHAKGTCTLCFASPIKGRLTEDELARALGEELHFGVSVNHPAGTATADPSTTPTVPYVQPLGAWP